MEAFTPHLPKLSFSTYKGMSGKVGIIGGSTECCGFPFFAGAASLNLGSDLSHIFCAKDVAIPIKSMQPEQIVHPYLPDNEDFTKILESANNVFSTCETLHSNSIGLGLNMQIPVIKSFAEQLIEKFRSFQRPFVIDSSMIDLIIEKPDLFKNCPHFLMILDEESISKLSKQLQIDTNPSTICSFFGGIKLFIIGNEYKYADTSQIVDIEYQRFRINGEEALLVGLITTLLAWAPHNCLLACNAASEAYSSAAKIAYIKKSRSTRPSDIIDSLYQVLPDTWNYIE